MARVYIDGFEDNTLNRWILAGQEAVISSGQFASGTYSVRLNGNGYTAGTTADYLFATAVQACYVAFKTKLGNNWAGYDGWFFHMMDYPTGLVSLKINDTGTIYIYNGATVVATATLAGWANEHRFELYVNRGTGSADGEIIMKIDGAVAASANGLTIAGSHISAIRLQAVNNTTGAPYSYFDDVIIDDSSWPGSTQIQLLTVTGNGSTNVWTPSTGTDNHVLVDEVPPSDTDYVYTDTVNNSELYAMSDFVEPVAGIPWKIKCIQLQPRALYEGLSPVTSIQPIVKTGGTVYPTDGSGTLAITTVMTNPTSIFETNPGTGIAWTIAELDAMESGFKAKA